MPDVLKNCHFYACESEGSLVLIVGDGSGGYKAMYEVVCSADGKYLSFHKAKNYVAEEKAFRSLKCGPFQSEIDSLFENAANEVNGLFEEALGQVDIKLNSFYSLQSSEQSSNNQLEALEGDGVARSERCLPFVSDEDMYSTINHTQAGRRKKHLKTIEDALAPDSASASASASEAPLLAESPAPEVLLSPNVSSPESESLEATSGPSLILI